jgi:hypothetical protein
MKYLWPFITSHRTDRWRKRWCTESVLLMQCLIFFVLCTCMAPVMIKLLCYFSAKLEFWLTVILNLRSPSSGMLCHIIWQTCIDIVAEPFRKNSSHSSHHCEILKSHILSLLGWHKVSDKHIAFLVCFLKA